MKNMKGKLNQINSAIEGTGFKVTRVGLKHEYIVELNGKVIDRAYGNCALEKVIDRLNDKLNHWITKIESQAGENENQVEEKVQPLVEYFIVYTTPKMDCHVANSVATIYYDHRLLSYYILWSKDHIEDRTPKLSVMYSLVYTFSEDRMEDCLFQLMTEGYDVFLHWTQASNDALRSAKAKFINKMQQSSQPTAQTETSTNKCKKEILQYEIYKNGVIGHEFSCELVGMIVYDTSEDAFKLNWLNSGMKTRAFNLPNHWNIKHINTEQLLQDQLVLLMNDGYSLDPVGVPKFRNAYANAVETFEDYKKNANQSNKILIVKDGKKKYDELSKDVVKNVILHKALVLQNKLKDEYNLDQLTISQKVEKKKRINYQLAALMELIDVLGINISNTELSSYKG